MTLLRMVALLLSAALLGACASTPAPAGMATASEAEIVEGNATTGAAAPAIDVAPAAAEAPAATATGTAPAEDASVMASQVTTAADADADAGAVAATDASPAVSAEEDFAAIYGDASYNPVADPSLPEPVRSPATYDPWEKYNRKIHTFNNAIDHAVARPLARAYVAVVPRPVRLGVTNFFDNLGQPVAMLNYLLQGQPKLASQALARFLLNSTLGIGGLFDPASDAKLPRGHEDFGQTLGVWGWKNSRYVELPLFGPRTVRDVLGFVGDAPVGIVRQIENDKVRIFTQGLNLVDTRSQLLSLDSLRDGAVDDYQLVRDSWLQRRAYQIESARRRGQEEDSGLPDYLLDDVNNPTVPVDAMPMPDISGGG
ncbi:MlaA family lipoprotein [Pseudoxanthomonas dokdonensis]|uniref:Lipoprotein n=1 Tax=Pseudoxanthomonas dokdonensis TaxID=344882 RepID=A0A0R0CTB3_9GAMM|nr:MlaA family lipoprotein [Pseudoxanthomonas dokdonensis]KRG68483.1 lipoprotein [Pseudoxanthomonas dokdonensis]